MTYTGKPPITHLNGQDFCNFIPGKRVKKEIWNKNGVYNRKEV